MSWDLMLIDPLSKDPVDVDAFTEGGTFPIGGTDKAVLNITYNYGKLFDFKYLNGKQAKDMIELLTYFAVNLGIEKDRDYWRPTPGNVGYTIKLLLKWAKSNPYAFFIVS